MEAKVDTHAPLLGGKIDKDAGCPMLKKTKYMKMNQQMIGVFAVLLLLGGVLLLAPSLRATPLVSWNPSTVTQEVASGQSKTFVLNAKALGSALPNAVVVVSPELAEILTVIPSDPGTVPHGKSITLTVNVNPPATFAPSTVEGTITLRKKNPSGDAFGPALPVKISVTWPRVVNDGIAVTYPADWSLDQKIIDLGQTIRITNFGTSYLHGGIVPEGGAQISVLAIPLPGDSIEDIIAQDTEGGVVISNENTEIAGSPGKKVTFEIDLGGELRYRRTAVYIPRGSQLNKFILDYRSDDPNEAHFLQVFNQMLTAVTFD